MNIEVELRSFISKEQHTKLLAFFTANGTLINQDEQETHYFDCPEDLRIQKNNTGAKIWLKKGKLHDEAREEIEIPTIAEDFDQLQKLFTTLGYNVDIKWFRTRHTFQWKGINAMVDYTKGYGYILELERISTEKDKDKARLELYTLMKELNITITPREEFDKKFKEYKNNWRALIKQ